MDLGQLLEGGRVGRGFGGGVGMVVSLVSLVYRSVFDLNSSKLTALTFEVLIGHVCVWSINGVPYFVSRTRETTSS